MGQDIRLETRSDARLLGAIRGLVRCYVGSFGFRSERVDEVVLAVDEACANAIRHAYGGRKDRKLELTLRDEDGWIAIAVRDSGRPAPLERVQRKRLGARGAETLRPGGLGVHFMYRVFDEVAFEPGARRGNRVTMRLKCPKARRADARQEE